MSPRRLVLVALALVLTAACGSSDPSAPDATTASQQAPLPQVGECHKTDSNTLPQVLRPSPVVPCTSPHTLETVAVVPLPAKPLPAQMKSYNTQCAETAKAFVGLDTLWPTRFVQFILTAPATEPQMWLRCDIGVVATTDGKTVSELSASLENVAKDAPASVTRCLDELPAPATNQPYVPCTEPHLAAAAQAYATLDAKSAYPNPDDLLTQGRLQCKALVADRADSGQLTVYAVWQSEAAWKANRQDQVNAVCWYYRTDGKDLPPLDD